MNSNCLTNSLYIIATPIGNLQDISLRAVELLRTVDVIAAEDTRHIKTLLTFYNIQNKKIISFYDQNEKIKSQKIIEDILEGKSYALVSDAGTPTINDPGFNLINLAHKNNIKVVPIPGACAVISALSVSGISSTRFSFEGYLPHKKIAKENLLQELLTEKRTMVFYETPHRILETVKILKNIFEPTREICFLRELTKKFETVKLTRVENLLDFVESDSNQIKGEMVIVLAGYQEKDKNTELTIDAKNIMDILSSELPTKQAANLAAKITGFKKKDLYDYHIDK